MDGIKLKFITISALVILASCGTKPEPVQIPVPEPAQIQVRNDEPVQAVKPAAVTGSVGDMGIFNPSSVSPTYYNTVKDEVRHFIDDLNHIIQDKDYDSWKKALSSEYFADISSEANLMKISELPAMATRKIVLKTPEDYFINVVVPSRDNCHVDDIEFFGRNKVKAFTVLTNKAGDEQRIRLYDLEKINNMWKIIN